MTRYIDADKLREKWLHNGANERIYNTNDFLDSIDEASTEDVAPVRRGVWKDCPRVREFCYCSVCEGRYVSKEWFDDKKWTYCPNCGAKMEG